MYLRTNVNVLVPHLLCPRMPHDSSSDFSESKNFTPLGFLYIFTRTHVPDSSNVCNSLPAIQPIDWPNAFRIFLPRALASFFSSIYSFSFGPQMRSQIEAYVLAYYYSIFIIDNRNTPLKQKLGFCLVFYMIY